MKFIEEKEPPKKFVPFRITIEFETEEEATAFHNIINHSYITKAAFNDTNLPSLSAIRTYISKKVGDSYYGFSEFDRELSNMFEKE